MLRPLLVGIVPIPIMWLFAGAPQAQQSGPPPGVPSESSTSRFISSSVVATTMVVTLDGKSSLNLMVLWRGSVGWYLKPGPRSSGGGGNSRTISARTQYGGVSLVAELDRESRDVRLQGAPVSLEPANANVILVDFADGPDLKVVATLRVDPAMPADKSIEPLLRQSKQIVTFLQCDQKIDNAMAQLVADRTCSAVVAK